MSLSIKMLIFRIIRAILVGLAAGYVLLCGLLYFYQEHLLFIPYQEPIASLERLASEMGFEPWLNDGKQQIGWQSIHGNSNNVILYFPGNGGNTLRQGFTAPGRVPRNDSRKTFLLEYPGYGARPGVPSEKSLVEAAIDALELVQRTPRRTILVVGQSMGSGVACSVVAQRPQAVSGLILITPYNSLAGAAHSHYPWVPVSLLLKTRFDSDRNLEKYHGPVAIAVGEHDTIVPPVLARKLYEGYTGPKRLWTAGDAGHGPTALVLSKWPEMMQWLEQSINTAR